MTEYKVGDKVVLVTERPAYWNYVGEMDKFLGSVQSIRAVSELTVRFEDSNTAKWSFSPDSILGLAGKTGNRVDIQLVNGRKYLVLSDDDADFPKGTVVTCINAVAGWFSSERWADMFMYDWVKLLEILDPTENTVPTAVTVETDELTFIQLIEKLPELAEGTVITSSHAGDLTVKEGTLHYTHMGVSMHLGQNAIKATYRITSVPTVPKEVYTSITWQEALQIIADEGTVYVGSETATEAFSRYADIEEIAVDFDDIFSANWFKKELK